MYQSKYYTCEEIDERLLKGYYDDAVLKGYSGSLDQMRASLASENYIDLTILYPGQDFNFTTAVERVSSLVTSLKRGFRFSYVDIDYSDGVYLTFEYTGDTLSNQPWVCVGDLTVTTNFVDNIPTSIELASAIALGRLPSRWIVKVGNLQVGFLDILTDNGGHQLTQILTTNYQMVDGVFTWSTANEAKIYTYYRKYNIDSSLLSSGTAEVYAEIGTWSAWKEYIPDTITNNLVKETSERKEADKLLSTDLTVASKTADSAKSLATANALSISQRAAAMVLPISGVNAIVSSAEAQGIAGAGAALGSLPAFAPKLGCFVITKNLKTYNAWSGFSDIPDDNSYGSTRTLYYDGTTVYRYNGTTLLPITHQWQVMTTSQYEKLPDKDENTFYYILEDD